MSISSSIFLYVSVFLLALQPPHQHLRGWSNAICLETGVTQCRESELYSLSLFYLHLNFFIQKKHVAGNY